MNRRQFTTATLGAALGIPLAAREIMRASDAPAATAPPRRPLPVPADGVIRTAIAIGPHVNVIDMSGPWEVFQDAVVAQSRARFELFTVAADAGVVEATGGLRIEPTYTYGSAPAPHVVVIPAHMATPDTVRWIRDVARRAHLVMSVCTGAFTLAETGLLDGKTATTHHGSYDDFQRAYPRVRLVRSRRFVEHDRLATAGGLTSGIDLALRVVERYLGRRAADRTANYMEYRRAPTVARE